MKQKKLEGLLVPSVVAGVLLLPVGGGSVCVGEDKTGTAGPHTVSYTHLTLPTKRIV